MLCCSEATEVETNDGIKEIRARKGKSKPDWQNDK